MSNTNPPSITLSAFSCPHCGVYTTQYWFRLHANSITGNTRTPTIPNQKTIEKYKASSDIDAKIKERLIKWATKIQLGFVYIERNDNSTYLNIDVNNLHISSCFDCNKVAVWVHDNLVYPPVNTGDMPNADLPEDIAHDFQEARSILNSSPRGAAALLRLAVQKLCAFLGEEGRNIDTDIASLVAKGLNPLVQKSLDIVRVVGNEAVHPGVLDLRDDRDTALQLLRLVNIIAEQMITHPKTIQAMYAQLPESKRHAIDARNVKALTNEKKQ